MTIWELDGVAYALLLWMFWSGMGRPKPNWRKLLTRLYNSSHEDH
jgi:hypothetical protein